MTLRKVEVREYEYYTQWYYAAIRHIISYYTFFGDYDALAAMTIPRITPAQAKKEIETLLKVPSSMSLVCLIAVGYPEESPKKERRPVDQVLEFIH
jgi:hypothetical protein